ncbi:MAG: hypothetical protein JRJ12_07365 [Deltaproteobacteria bacterium]|nr:hypothetical protein [Deltaproteobacteria bacterium]MBW2071249.1 hypothetical protein [Deltaproteobacteria bacterium]
MTQQLSMPNGDAEETFKMYASTVGARFMRRANKIFEDFPTSKYLLYFCIYTVEVIIAFWIGMQLGH